MPGLDLTVVNGREVESTLRVAPDRGIYWDKSLSLCGQPTQSMTNTSKHFMKAQFPRDRFHLFAADSMRIRSASLTNSPRRADLHAVHMPVSTSNDRPTEASHSTASYISTKNASKKKVVWTTAIPVCFAFPSYCMHTPPTLILSLFYLVTHIHY